jgi:hypothetical protein
MSGTTRRQIEAVVSVNDRTAGPLAVISARLRAIAGMSGMERIRASALGVQRSFAGVASSIGRVAAVAGVLGAGAGAGLVAMVRGAADTTGELDDLSKRLGMSTRDLQAFRYAAVASGQSGETFTAAMIRLNRGMAQAASGGNQELAGLFQRLGIDLRGANGQVRSAADVMPQLAQAFMRNENAALRTRMAMVAFGRSGEALLPMFTDGAEGLQRLTDTFRQYGYQFSDEEIARGASFGDTMDSLMVAVRGTSDAIGARLIPVIEPLLQGLRDWIRANRELIAGQVGEWASAVADWLRQIDFGEVRDSLARFLEVARSVFDAIGGWRGVIVGLIAVITGPLIAAFATMTAALLGNPIGAAIAVLVGAAALIYLHWGEIVDFFQGVWDGVVGAWNRFASSEHMQEAGRIFGVVAGAIMTAWEPIEGFFRSLWSGITSAFTAAWEVIGPIVRMVVRGAEALAGITSGAGANPAFAPEAQQQRAQNEARRGLLGGFYDGPAIDPDTGEPAFQPMSRQPGGVPGFQPLYRQPGVAPAAPAQAPQGEVRVRVDFDNLPAGARVQADSTGTGVQSPELDVGYATMGAF